MISYVDACKKAQRMFSERGYLDLVEFAYDMPDKWMFVGKRFADERPDYGNVPVTVNKKTGDATWYRCNSPENIGESLKAVPIPLPV